MVYTTYEDMSDCLRRNAWKVPADVDLIVGVPRSGMIPALMLAELLNIRCVDLDAFLERRMMSCGNRQKLMRGSEIKKVLVLEDTVFFGRSIDKARKRVLSMNFDYEYVFACVYAEGRNAKQFVDIYFEDIYREGENLWLYEWNILHHYGQNTSRFMFDIDGLLCKEPPDDRNVEAYESYLPNAVPMVVPTTHVGAIVSYRLEKYREVTTQWLRKQGIEYGQLYMFPATNRDERQRMDTPESYKALIYRKATWAVLFIESDDRQARDIFQLTGKPVFCYENGKMYK